MKKWLIVIATLLLLTGCAQNAPDNGPVDYALDDGDIVLPKISEDMQKLMEGETGGYAHTVFAMPFSKSHPEFARVAYGWMDAHDIVICYYKKDIRSGAVFYAYNTINGKYRLIAAGKYDFTSPVRVIKLSDDTYAICTKAIRIFKAGKLETEIATPEDYKAYEKTRIPGSPKLSNVFYTIYDQKDGYKTFLYDFKTGINKEWPFFSPMSFWSDNSTKVALFDLTKKSGSTRLSIIDFSKAKTTDFSLSKGMRVGAMAWQGDNTFLYELYPEDKDVFGTFYSLDTLTGKTEKYSFPIKEYRSPSDLTDDALIYTKYEDEKRKQACLMRFDFTTMADTAISPVFDTVNEVVLSPDGKSFLAKVEYKERMEYVLFTKKDA